MKRALRPWLLGIAAVLLLAAVALVGLVVSRLPSDEEAAVRIAEAFEKRFGVGLEVGGAHWSLWPSPVLVLSDVATVQPRPVTLRRVTLQLRLRELLQRVVAVDELEVESLVLPRESLQAFRGKGPRPGEGRGAFTLPAPWTLAPVPIENIRWRDVVWIDRRGIALAYDGEIAFDTLWRPREARVERAGASPPARLRLEREPGQDRWRTRIDVGGGSWNGVSVFELRPNDALRVSAELEARDIDLAGLLKAFDRRAAVAGKVSGRSTLEAEAGELGALLRSLHTRTTFALRPATLVGLDLAKAVSTAGVSRGGTTPLDELTGTLDTQGGEDGTVMRYTNLKARSGVLTASGQLRFFNRKLDGAIAVDIVDGVVGVPLKIGGTASDPEVSLTGGALAGAAVGSAVLPGVGTAIGARLGQEVEKLFGTEAPKAEKKNAPSAPRR
jgi:uncharacterized protein involved in outer membrane biogenesis